MHQCDICCWYVSDARGCECPLVMREKACEEARIKASNINTVKKESSKNKSDSINVEDVVVKRVENTKITEQTCSHCHKHYKSTTTTDYNKSGMYISYSYCPECGHKNLSSWHVW